VDQYVLQWIAVVPSHEGRSGVEVARTEGAIAAGWPGGHAFFVYLFHGCCILLGNSEL
jgi:hypothetical protein